MTYRAASGWNNAAGLTTDLDPQPRSVRLVPGAVRYAASGLAYEDGAYNTRLIFDALTWTQYNSLCTQLFVSSAKSAQVTLRLRRNDNTFAAFNAVIVRPTFTEDAEVTMGVLLDVNFLVRGAVAI